MNGQALTVSSGPAALNPVTRLATRRACIAPCAARCTAGRDVPIPRRTRPMELKMDKAAWADRFVTELIAGGTSPGHPGLEQMAESYYQDYSLYDPVAIVRKRIEQFGVPGKESWSEFC